MKTINIQTQLRENIRTIKTRSKVFWNNHFATFTATKAASDHGTMVTTMEAVDGYASACARSPLFRMLPGSKGYLEEGSVRREEVLVL